MIYELLSPLKDEFKKRTICNLGYEENTYPYLNKLINISFYFEKHKTIKSDMISVIPKYNLIDANMDSIINIKILEPLKETRKANGPSRVYYKNESDSWYTIEGAYMKNFQNDKKYLDSKKYYYNFNGEIYEKKKVFFSTFKNELKNLINPGSLLFILYVVEDLLFDREKHEYNEEEEEIEEKSENKSEDSNENSNNNSSDSKKSKEEEKDESSKNSD